MRRADIVGGSLLLIFALAMIFVVLPRENTEGVWHGLSPYFFPTVMLVGIGLASLGLVVQALAKPSLYETDANPLTLERLAFFLLISATIVLCVLVMHGFGFWTGGPLLIAAAMIFMGERSPIRILPVAVLPVAVVYALVTYLLQSPLP